MTRRITGLVVLALSAVGAGNARAQEAVADADTLRSYDLDEVVVVGGPEAQPVPYTLQRVALAGIAMADASSADELLRLIPAAHVQTNSRGEAMVYLRGAGDRQTAVFFDGAPLNTAWDGRYDLSMVPADVVGEIDVAKGSSSVLYGANVLGGAVLFRPRTLAAPGGLTELQLAAGSGRLRQGRASRFFSSQTLDYGLSLGFSGRDAIPLPDRHGLTFSQSDESSRTNTDRELLDVFGHVAGRFRNGGRLRLTVLHVDGQQGVAPEGHLDPTVSRVRFWRYPSRSQTTAILAFDLPVAAGRASLRNTAWVSRQRQSIDQYGSETYTAVIDREDHSDLTVGSRLAAMWQVQTGTISVALNGLTSRHALTEYQPEEVLPANTVTELVYRQHLWSLGTEYERSAAGPLQLSVGAALEGIATPATGDKPAPGPQANVSVSSGLRYTVDVDMHVRVSAGRRVRFPTMRELFGQALGRFLLNPDLRPESSVLLETAVATRRSRWSAESVVFFERFHDTIEQRSVFVAGEDLPRRQRVNLDGGRTYGAELIGRIRLARSLSLSNHLTWIRARVFENGDTNPRVEKPEYLGTATLNYNMRSGLAILVQCMYTGSAYGLDEQNEFVPLPSALMLNARAAYRLTMGTAAVEVFGRVDNLTDELLFPQPGLPAPGRTFRVGVDVSIYSRRTR